MGGGSTEISPGEGRGGDRGDKRLPWTWFQPQPGPDEHSWLSSGSLAFFRLPPTGSRNKRELELLPALCQAPWVDLKTQRNKMQSVPALGGAQS